MDQEIENMKNSNMVSWWGYSKKKYLEKKYNVQAEHLSKGQVNLLICVKYFKE